MKQNWCKPKMVEASDYSSLGSILQAFPELEYIAAKKRWKDGPAHGLVISSFNLDNIHKAVKYGVWTPTRKYISKLQQLAAEYAQQRIDTFLFFKLKKDNKFVGAARLIGFYGQDIFDCWIDQLGYNHQTKYIGICQISWVYVKDLPFRQLPLDLSQLIIDTFYLTWQKVQVILQKFEATSFKLSRSIFRYFQLLDDNEVKIRKHQKVRPIDSRYFQQQRIQRRSERDRQIALQQRPKWREKVTLKESSGEEQDKEQYSEEAPEEKQKVRSSHLHGLVYVKVPFKHGKSERPDKHYK